MLPAIEKQLPIIRPITDLRTHLNEVCEQAVSGHEPVILTKNGVPAFVLTDAATHDAQQRRNRAYLAIREAEIEARYRPEAIPSEESDKLMKGIFDTWGLDYARA